MKFIKLAGILLLVFALGAGAGALITRSIVRERLHRGGISSLEDAVMLAHHSGQGELINWGGMKTYATDDRSVSPGKVIFFGDSITASWNLQHGWINRGISGQTTGQMLVRYRQDVLDLRPSTVVILAGVNDARIGSVSIEATENNIETMVELARLHGIKPILCSLLPTGHHPLETPAGDPVAQVQNLNSWLASYAQSQGISFVNYYDSLLGEGDAIRPELTDDGLHPNEAGYSVMDRVIEKSIAQTSGPPTK